MRSSRSLELHDKPKQSSDGLEIYAPEPPVSCSYIEPSMVVTERLAKLARRPGRSRSGSSLPHKHRELRPFERGHWLVDCTNWGEDKRKIVWDIPL